MNGLDDIKIGLLEVEEVEFLVDNGDYEILLELWSFWINHAK